MTQTQQDLIYLLSCAVNKIAPDKEKVTAMDLERLYKFSEWHTLRSAVHIALRSAGVNNKSFQDAYNKAVRKNTMLDLEREDIFDAFEQHGIWYLPLKGSILKELYPEIGMREMADNDVLYDSSKQSEVKDIMLAKGYTAESIGKTHHDVYMKQPVFNFELHTALFSSAHAEPLYQYYADIQRLLIKDESNNFGYHFSDEDFYIFMTAHEWKHYNGSGTGIRSLLDCYVYCKNKGDTLDWNYIMEQCKQLEIADFEQERRELAVKVFSSDTLPDLTDAETDMLIFYLTAGTYGTFDNAIKKKLKDQSKLSFWVHSIFIPRKQMAASVPFTAKSPLLYPVGIFWRTFRVMLFKQDKIKQTIKAVKKYGK